MNKQQILDEIRRLAAENGKAPGWDRFKSETGLPKSDWFPKPWLRWNDAIREAGLEPNSWGTKFDCEFMIKKYIGLIRELKRYPIDGDLKIKRLEDKTFPNPSAFYRLGSKSEFATQILEYCCKRDDCSDITPFCLEVLSKSPPQAPRAAVESRVIGYVYLVKHGSRREYKIGKTVNPVRREGEIALQLPEKLEPIHNIKTDDPSGVERYWHMRFADRRKEGEWFALTSADVQAFKRWRRIY